MIVENLEPLQVIRITVVTPRDICLLAGYFRHSDICQAINIEANCILVSEEENKQDREVVIHCESHLSAQSVSVLLTGPPDWPRQGR